MYNHTVLHIHVNSFPVFLSDVQVLGYQYHNMCYLLIEFVYPSFLHVYDIYYTSYDNHIHTFVPIRLKLLQLVLADIMYHCLFRICLVVDSYNCPSFLLHLLMGLHTFLVLLFQIFEVV